MKTSLFVLSLALLLILCSIAVRHTFESKEPTAIPHPSAPPSEQATPEINEAPPWAVGNRPPAAPRQVKSTEPHAPLQRTAVPEKLRGRVISADGSPIAAATLTWTQLRDEFQERAWRSQDWEAIAEASVVATSGLDGEFAFDLPQGEPAVPSVIWVVHAGHMAQPLLLLDRRDLLVAREVRLEPAKPVSVTVRDSSGAVATGATVTVRGLFWGKHKSSRDPWEVRAQRVFVWTETTDEAGRCLLPAAPKQVVAQAKQGARISPSKWAHEKEELELVLRSGFRLSGTVFLADDPPFPEDVLVRVAVDTDSDWEELGSLAVENDGTFGPAEFHSPRTAEADCRLAGGGLFAKRVPFQVPSEGGSVDVTIEATFGESVTARIENAEGEPIRTARACCSFVHDPDWSAWYDADEEGRVEIGGLPKEDEFSFLADAEGYERRFFGPYRLPPEEDEYVLALGRSGKLEVVVTHKGEPVDKYDVIHWDDHPIDFQWTVVDDAEDGRFVVETVPEGVISLYAFSPKHTQSEIVTVRIRPDEVARAELELTDPVVGVGRVIDGNTYLPIDDAEIQVYSSVGGQFTTAWGPPHPVDSDGRFRAEAFAPGNARLMVNAPDYEEDYVSTVPIPGQLLDFGDLPLYPTRSMTVQLVSDEITDFSAFELSTSGMRRFGPTGFSSDGLVQLDGCIDGYYLFHIEHPDGRWSYFSRNLSNAEPWHVEWRLDAGTELIVEVPEKEGIHLADTAYVGAHHQGSSGSSFVWAELSEERKAVFPALAGEEVVLEIEDSSGDTVARERVALAPPGPQTVSLVLGTPQAFRFRAVTSAGDPIPGASVHANCEGGGAGGWSTEVDADGDGYFTLEAPPCGRLSLVVYQPVFGTHLGIPADVPADPDQVVDVVVDTSYTVAVQLKDGAEPVTGVKAYLELPGSSFGLPRRHPDRQGRVAWTRMGPGRYRLMVGAPGYWTADALVEATRTRTKPKVVQLVRTGDLVVRVLCAGGEAVPRVALEVASLGFPGEVEDWVEAGRVLSSGGTALITDDGGSLSLRGLPRGEYEVRARTAAGTAATCRTTVPSWARGEVSLRLP